ncbi:MAG: hypothetical protein Q9199_000015 [Rusavskia elegans]
MHPKIESATDQAASSTPQPATAPKKKYKFDCGVLRDDKTLCPNPANTDLGICSMPSHIARRKIETKGLISQSSSEGPAVEYPSIPTSGNRRNPTTGDPDIPTTGNPTTEDQDEPMPDFSDASKHDRSVAYGKFNAQEQTGKHLLEVLNNQAEMAKSIKSFEKELGSHAQQIRVLGNAPSPEQLHLTVRDLMALAAELERVKAEFLVTKEISEDQLARRIDGLDTKLSK